MRLSLRSLAVVLTAVLAASCFAQSGAETGYMINRITIEGNSAISTGVIRELLKTRESPSGFSAWIYRNISQTLGSKPEYYDPPTFADDYEKVKDFYLAQGFLDARVDTTIRISEEKKSVDLGIVLHENSQYTIDSVVMAGLDHVDSTFRATAITGGSVLTSGMPYDRFKIEAEIRRIVGLLQNNGYPNALYLQDPYSQYRVSRKARGGMLTLAFHTGSRYRFGSVQIVNEGEETVDSAIVLRELEFSQGENYSVEKRELSIQNLNKLGIFESVRVQTPFPAAIDSSAETIVPVTIYLTARKRHEVVPEIFVNDGNDAFNLGVGAGYSDRNFLGNADNFTMRLRLRVQSLQNLRLRQGIRDSTLVGNGDFTLQWTQPYFLSKRLSSIAAFSAIADKQQPYLQTIFRLRAGVQNRFATYTFGTADWFIERSQVISYDSVNARLLLQSRADSAVNQFNSVLSLSLYRDKTNNPFSPSSGFFHSLTIEEAGVVSILMRKIQPSLGYAQYVKVDALGRWYYTVNSDTSSIIAFRLHAGAADRYGETRSRKDPAFDIPVNRRFYAGGSTSVRGWQYRELGMMANPLYGGDAIVEGNFEWRWNVFKPIGKQWIFDFPAMWLVFFTDAGNVWGNVKDIRIPTFPQQVAIAAGVGYRYETFFGPIRIDFGMKMYDPKGQPGRKWVSQKRFWNEVFTPGVLHFGIAHAF